jgi:hypothetical protein
MSRSADRIVGWVVSLVAALLVSFLLNLAVALLFGNGEHTKLIRRFFVISELLFHPGFEGGIFLVAGNVLVFSVPLTLVFAIMLKRYTF